MAATISPESALCERRFRRLLPQRKTPTPCGGLCCGLQRQESARRRVPLRLTLLQRETGQTLRFESTGGKEAPTVILLCEYLNGDQAGLQDHNPAGSPPGESICPASQDHTGEAQTPFFTPEEDELLRQLAANPGAKANVHILLGFIEKNNIGIDPSGFLCPRARRLYRKVGFARDVAGLVFLGRGEQ